MAINKLMIYLNELNKYAMLTQISNTWSVIFGKHILNLTVPIWLNASNCSIDLEFAQIIEQVQIRGFGLRLFNLSSELTLSKIFNSLRKLSGYHYKKKKLRKEARRLKQARSF